MESQKTNFVGNAKTFGSKLEVTLNWEDLKRIKKIETKSGKKLVVIDIIPLREESKWGHSHTVVEHTNSYQKTN